MAMRHGHDVSPVLTNFRVQVLAVDLLNPTPAAEARKHKLKVGIFQSLLR